MWLVCVACEVGRDVEDDVSEQQTKSASRDHCRMSSSQD